METINNVNCLLCLDTFRENSDNDYEECTRKSLFALVNYLSNSKSEDENSIHRSTSLPSVFKACPECQTLLETFTRLLRQLEIAKMKVDSCLRQVRDVMLEGDKFGTGTSDASIKGSLRKGLIDNAERQVAISEPFVRLSRKRFISSHLIHSSFSLASLETKLEMDIKSEAAEIDDADYMQFEIDIEVPFVKSENVTQSMEDTEVSPKRKFMTKKDKIRSENLGVVQQEDLTKPQQTKFNTSPPDEHQNLFNSFPGKDKATHLDWMQALSGNCTPVGMQMLNQMIDLDIISVTVNKPTEFLNFGLICDAKKRGLRPIIFPSGLLLLEKDVPTKTPDELKDWHCVCCLHPPAEDGVMVYSLKDLEGKSSDLKRPLLMHKSCAEKQKIEQSCSCKNNLQESANKELREFHLPLRLMKAHSLEMSRMELRRKLKEVKIDEKMRKGNPKRSESLLKRNQVIKQVKEMGPHFELEEEIAYLNENLMKDLEIGNAELSAQGTDEMLQNEREWINIAAMFFLKELNAERNARLEQDKNSVDQYTCPYCFLVLGNPNKKFGHVRKFHEKELLIRCTNHPDCEYVDGLSSNVRRHQQRKKACPYKKVKYKSRSHIP